MRKILNIRNGFDEDDLNTVAGVLRDGGVIIYPTDTLYGFGCDAGNREAVQRIADIKHRDAASRYLVLIHNFDQLKQVAIPPADPIADQLKQLWPGPLSVVLMAADGQSTVGVRVPDHRFCIELLKKFSQPLVSTSVNNTGQPPLTNAFQISDEFGDRVDLIVDEGDTARNIASTVIDLSGDKPKLVREGSVPREKLKSILKD